MANTSSRLKDQNDINLPNEQNNSLQVSFQDNNKNTSTEQGDKNMNLNEILQRTYATEMCFKGESQNWTANFIVEKKVMSIENKDTNIKISVFPKKNKDNDTTPIGKVQYLIETSNGKISGEKDLLENMSINIDKNTDCPLKNEKIKINIIWQGKKEIIELSNIIPDNVISPEQAFRNALNLFYKTFKHSPPINYSFFIAYDMQGRNYWQVSFDDNDGIGGKSYIYVDAITGKVGDNIVNDE
jgi:hypothetical protein